MADNVELETVAVDGDKNAEDGAPAANGSSPATSSAANGDDCNGTASAASSARPTPDSSPRLQYQRNNPTNPAEPGRFRKRGENGAETPKRKLSLMEVEALRDRKRLGHLKEVERILAESLGSAHTFSEQHFTSIFVSPELTTHFFGLYDWDGAGYLDQEEWIEFLKGRVKTNHQRELVEVVETAAYLICGNEQVTLEKFRNILEAKGVAVKFFRIFSEKTHHHLDLKGTMDFIANLSNARPRTGFTQENMEWLEQLFRGQLGNSQELQFEDFKKIVHSKNPFFAERVFQIFDRDNSGAVSLQEFLDAMHQFAGQSHDDKIRFLFKVYDLDGDGLIQHRELQHVMHACMEENGMTFSQEQIEDLTSALFEDADVEAEGAITYEDLKAQLEKHEGLLENLSISIDRWLVPPQPKRTVTCLHGLSTMKPYQFSTPYIKNNYAYLTFLVAFLAVQIGLFVSRCVQFSDFPVSYIIARACGQTLNFCCAFILAVMLRNLITLARTNGLATYLPLDEHIYFHKMAGWFIFIYSLLHTIAHFINFAVNVVPTDGFLHGLNEGRNYTYAEWLLTMRPGKFGLIHGFANPSGIALMIILAVMVICSQPFVRKKGNFEVFYYTHLLYIPYYVLLILHGPNFWKWFIVPGVIYVIERIIRLVRTKTGQGRTYISSGILLPSKVTHLVIKRPSSLDYHPGDYLFVNIPAIAKYEWHPFTISSAPEQDETLWLHIRALGGWTHRLYDYFEEEQMKLECREEAAEQDVSIQLHKNDQSSLHRIQKSIKKLANSNDKSRRISFNTKPPEVRTDGVINEGCEEEVVMEPIEEDQAAEQGDQQAVNRGFNNKKQPLLKTVSLPDMEHRMKKRQKMMMLRHQMRSTSETQFDESTLEKAKTQLNNLPYLNPQNRSVAKSFRYMRRKPTIIAFKTPSSNSIETERPEKPETPETKMEEGRFEAVAMTEGGATQYPVGKPLEIYIDGPYGTPSSHIFRAQHAVLIGTGIGVTPFASILQSIMYRYWKNRHKCPRCEHQWTGSLPESVMYLKKVDFFWINRDQRSFEWFVNLLSQLEIEQAEQGGVMDRFLDMHMYITSALQKTDMKAVGLQLALDLLHEKEKRDMITGLKTRTIAGRPNWNKVFRQIQEQRKGKVTVFFCGPPALSRTLRYKCDEFGFKFRKENF